MTLRVSEVLSFIDDGSYVFANRGGLGHIVKSFILMMIRCGIKLSRDKCVCGSNN